MCLLRDEDLDLQQFIESGATPMAILQHIEDALQGRYASHDGEEIQKVERPMWRIGG